ncbi:MAG: c-type cytochrome [Sulfuricurvum sp.]
MSTKNIVVAGISLVVVALMALTASRGGAYQGGEHHKVIGNLVSQVQESSDEGKTYGSATLTQGTSSDEHDEELDALKKKASNIGAVKISAEYRSRCAACHGIDGSGEQDGRVLMGPALYGQSSEKIYKDLIDFKDGRKENVVMKGLLINTSTEELRRFADEIGAFATQGN